MNRINLICLGVKNLPESLSFYKALGFKTYETKDKPAIVFFDTNGTKLELYPLEHLVKDISEENPPEIRTGGFNGITLAINMKTKEEVDQFMEKVEAVGGTIAKKPEQNPYWDGYSGYFQDLDGYYWEVAYGASWKFDENEMLIIE